MSEVRNERTKTSSCKLQLVQNFAQILGKKAFPTRPIKHISRWYKEARDFSSSRIFQIGQNCKKRDLTLKTAPRFAQDIKQNDLQKPHPRQIFPRF